MEFICMSDVGRCRRENQDSCDAFEKDGALFVIVADGMGGMNGGSIASKMAVETARAMIEEQYKPTFSESEIVSLLNSCAVSANADIYNAAQKSEELFGMGTTLVAAVVRDKRLIILNVGDSRAYSLKDGSLIQLTKDQSYVQYLIDKGEISEAEAINHPQKNVIMQAIGSETNIKCDIYESEYDEEPLLFCSDGLSNKVTKEEIISILAGKESVEKKASLLIEKANAAGGEDNITVVLVQS